MIRKAFTLIELLVVIAIIAILAAILFPVFAQAKEAAKKTQSLSNVKQQTLGVIMYAGDSDDTNTYSEYGIGDPGQWGTYGPQMQWYITVYPYIKNGKTYDRGNGVIQAYGNEGLWNDPSAPDKNQGQHYGINNDIAPSNYGILPDSPDFKKSINNSVVDAPASKVLIMNKCRNGADWSYPFLGAEEWFWTPTVSPNAGEPTRDGSEIASGQLPRDHGGFLNRDSTKSDGSFPDSELGQTPRFRYSGIALAGWADGHASGVKRGQLKWYENVGVRGPNYPWNQSWYPY